MSYLVKNEQGHWVHSTIWKVPAHSLVRVTVYQYDGDSGLRNPFLGQPRGVVGGTMTVNGKPLHVLDPDDASHTFTIPDLGVSVPLKGVADDAPNQCAVTPCTLAQAHNTIIFEFRTGKPGLHRWQCFVPCAAGWIYGLRRANADRRLDGRVPQGRLSDGRSFPSHPGGDRSGSCVAVVADLVVGFLLAPHMPPGRILELGVRPDRHQQRPCR